MLITSNEDFIKWSQLPDNSLYNLIKRNNKYLTDGQRAKYDFEITPDLISQSNKTHNPVHLILAAIYNGYLTILEKLFHYININGEIKMHIINAIIYNNNYITISRLIKILLKYDFVKWNISTRTFSLRGYMYYSGSPMGCFIMHIDSPRLDLNYKLIKVVKIMICNFANLSLATDGKNKLIYNIKMKNYIRGYQLKYKYIFLCRYISKSKN